jgi:hypothetical protein
MLCFLYLEKTKKTLTSRLLAVAVGAPSFIRQEQKPSKHGTEGVTAMWNKILEVLNPYEALFGGDGK